MPQDTGIPNNISQNESDNAALIKAVTDGDLNEAVNLINKGADASVKDHNGSTLTEILKDREYKTAESKKNVSDIIKALKKAELEKQSSTPTTLSSGLSHSLAATIKATEKEYNTYIQTGDDNEENYDTPTDPSSTYEPPDNNTTDNPKDIRKINSMLTNKQPDNTASTFEKSPSSNSSTNQATKSSLSAANREYYKDDHEPDNKQIANTETSKSEPKPPTTPNLSNTRPSSLSAASQIVQQSAQPKPNTFYSASLEGKGLQEAFEKLKNACAKINDSGGTNEKYEFKEQTKNYELKNKVDDPQKSIDHLMADAVNRFNLNPITISGGTMQQQIIAMQSAITRGFTDITVIPEDGYTNNQEYKQVFDNTIKLQKFKGHEEILKNIKDQNTPEQIMECLYTSTGIRPSQKETAPTMSMS